MTAARHHHRPQGHPYGCACWNGHAFKLVRDLTREFGEDAVALVAMELQNQDEDGRAPSVYTVEKALRQQKAA